MTIQFIIVGSPAKINLLSLVEMHVPRVQTMNQGKK